LGTVNMNGAGVGVGSFEIFVPSTALPTATTFIVTETMIPPPVDYVDFSPIYVVAPFITTRLPAKVTIAVKNEPWVPRANLSIYAAKDQFSPFTRVADSATSAAGVTGSVTELGAFFAGYPKSADQMNCP